MSSNTDLPAHTQQDRRFPFIHRGPHKDPVDNKRRLALILSYAPDWILTVVVAGLFFLLNNIEPFKREFSLTDTTIQHTYAVHERIPDSDLVLIAVVAPLVIMAVVNVISIRSFWDLHTSWLGVILGLALTGTVTNIVKVTANPGHQLVARGPIASIGVSLQRVLQTILFLDGFRSFPSGHSSLSFAGLGFLSMYLAGKLHLFDERGHTGKAWISLIPLMGAALVAISRTMDNRHHWQDVLVGGLLGLILGWFSYRQYYPALSHPLSHRPYSPRVARNRTPMPHLHEGGHPNNQHHETEHLQFQPDSRYPDQEEMELHGTARGSHVNHAGPPTDLREVWKQGDGDEVVPQGQNHSLSRPADEHV